MFYLSIYIYPSIHTHTNTQPCASFPPLHTNSVCVSISISHMWNLVKISKCNSLRQIPQDTNPHNKYLLEVIDKRNSNCF